MKSGFLGTPIFLRPHTMPERLTAAFLEALEANGRDRIVFDDLLSGFAIRCTPSGAKIFIVQAWAAGKKRRVTIGTYPEMKVTEARNQARPVLDDLRAGKNPIVEKNLRRQAIEAGDMTVSKLADQWMEVYVRPKLKPRTVLDYTQIFEQKIKPRLGHVAVAAVSRDEVTRFHLEMRKTPRRANYVLATLRALLTYAEDIGLRPVLSNPCRKLKMYREHNRERFLDEAEIGAAADAIARAERDGVIGPHAASGLRLALLTGARSGEVTAIKWHHIDWQRRQIRLPDSKGNTPRTILLNDAAVEVLKTTMRIGPYVIAGAEEGQPYKNLSRAWIIARKYAGLGDVRLHDLRHSYASLAARQGESLPMIGKLLGHKHPATTARYAHLVRDHVATVNDQLGELMQAAIDKRPAPVADNVVKLRRPRKRRVVRP
jgi:integrase